MHETPVKVKDVEFFSFLRPSELHGHKAVLQLAFRLPHMQHDEMIMNIEQDEEKALFTTNLEYYDAKEEQQFNLMDQFDEEELHELLKAVLNSETAKKELVYYGMDGYEGCYAKKIQDFEVIITHIDLTRDNTKDASQYIPNDSFHAFSNKEEALQFFHRLAETYNDETSEVTRESFGAYKVVWEEEESNTDILTYIMLHYQGKEIPSEEQYKRL